MKAQVSIARCSSYLQDEINSAVHAALLSFGGMKAFVKPEMKVLLKPNALMGDSPEAAVTTHPALVYAVIKEVLEAGGTPLVGDSPGNAHANVLTTMEKTGLKQATDAAGGEMVFFQQDKIIKAKNPSGCPLLPEIPVTEWINKADLIINLPKLKTHGMTLYTGAIKNMFGIVPGFFKTEFHRLAPHPKDFSSLLVDVYQIGKPGLTIMDAVVGMEGAGPSHGQPRVMGAVIASPDGVAVDAVGARLIGYRPEDIEMIAEAARRGLGCADLSQILVEGTPLEKLRQPDWKRTDTQYQLLKRFPFLAGLAARLIRIDPVVDQKKCVRCLVCLRSCPAKTISQRPDKKVFIDHKKCISCFCCHELCEYDAIMLKPSLITRLMGLA